MLSTHRLLVEAVVRDKGGALLGMCL